MRGAQDPKLRNQLKAGYLCLADFQEAVGSQFYGIAKQDANSPQAFMNRIAALKPSLTEIPKMTAAESKALMDQLEALGF